MPLGASHETVSPDTVIFVLWILILDFWPPELWVVLNYQVCGHCCTSYLLCITEVLVGRMPLCTTAIPNTLWFLSDHICMCIWVHIHTHTLLRDWVFSGVMNKHLHTPDRALLTTCPSNMSLEEVYTSHVCGCMWRPEIMSAFSFGGCLFPGTGSFTEPSTYWLGELHGPQALELCLSLSIDLGVYLSPSLVLGISYLQL